MSNPKRTSTQKGMGALTPTPPAPASARASRPTRPLPALGDVPPDLAGEDAQPPDSRSISCPSPSQPSPPRGETQRPPASWGASEPVTKTVSKAPAREPASSERPSAKASAPPVTERGARPKGAPSPGARAPKVTERRKRTSNPVRVDDVGDIAVSIAAGQARNAKPRVVKSRAEIALAPIGHQEAFVLSLVDGATTVQSLIDASGMPEQDVLAMLQRLARLGIVALK